MWTSHTRLQQGWKFWNRRLRRARLITLRIVTSTGSSDFITGWIDLKKKLSRSDRCSGSMVCIFKKNTTFFGFSGTPQCLAREGFWKSVTARNQRWLIAWWELRGNRNARARGRLLTKQEKSINKQTKFK